MSNVLIVIDQKKDWEPYYPSDLVISFDEYLTLDTKPGQKIRVINLCSDYSYLSQGYYCSLLSEARGHHVLPPSRILNEVSSPLFSPLNLKELDDALRKFGRDDETTDTLAVKSFFGQVSNPALKKVARLLFERFPCPILELTISHRDGYWSLTALKLVDHKTLSDEEETAFSDALDTFSHDVWRPKRARKSARYDLAILANSEEKMPPSNKAALKKFVKAGRNLGVTVDIISPNDIMRLPEYDGLFIRETTDIQHHTYRFAMRAEALGLVVIDDPTSILRCCNKIYLADLFRANKVPSPRTLILNRDNPEQLEKAAEELGFPIVVKIPDGSFSRGVAKVADMDEFRLKAGELFKDSSLLLVQEYIYTDFDWRIGVLNNKPLYACRYYMVRDHWQIYKHSENTKTTSGGYDTLPTFEVPRKVLQAALKSTRLIGDGFYGVDIKETKGKACVIEVNDNPSIETGVEDQYLGNELYSLIIQEFVRRMED